MNKEKIHASFSFAPQTAKVTAIGQKGGKSLKFLHGRYE
jgi:hypothetical protein